MLDITDYQFSGVSFATYAFLTLTTGILAYATLAEEPGGGTRPAESSIVDTITNPGKMFEMNPAVVPESAPAVMAQPMQGGRRRRTRRRTRGAATRRK